MNRALCLLLIASFTLSVGCSTGTREDPTGTVTPPILPPILPPPPPPPGTGQGYDPAWASVQPVNTIVLNHDPALSNGQNGAALAAALGALSPGDRLEIGAGTWSIEAYTDIRLQGTAAAPIWVVAQAGATPVITRSNANQNVLNIGASAPTRYVCFRGLEVTGGSAGIRLYDCANVWLDQCHVHHTAEVCLTANTRDTDRLFITRNVMHHGGGTAEGMYLGANNAAVVMSNSVIALNHVYECRGSQGDGIEVKQGSYGNLIAENLVHDTNYPAIIAYGTGGQAPNVIERNVCYNSGDNVMQVQGEAIVRNNLLMNGAGAGFHTHDHQGQTVNLVVVHNTIINSGLGMRLSTWSGRAGMVLANNAVYSQGTAINFSAGSLGVTVSGNVVLGGVSGYTGAGTSAGTGLGDFTNVAWNASQRDATPTAGSALVGAGDPAHAVTLDLNGKTRASALDAGCVDAP